MPSHDRLARAAVNAQPLGIELGDAELAVEEDEAVPHAFQDAAAAVALGAQRVGSPAALGHGRRDVLGRVQDVDDPAAWAGHGGVERSPPAFLECAAGAAYVVALQWHPVRHARGDGARQRSAELAHAVSAGIGGVVREHVKQLLAEHGPALGHGGAQILVAHRDDDVVGVGGDNQVGARESLDQLPQIHQGPDQHGDRRSCRFGPIRVRAPR